MMENRLKISDIAPYLPFRVHCMHQDRLCEIIGVNNDTNTIKIHVILDNWSEWVHVEDCKLILYSKETITHLMSHPDIDNSESFYPIDKILGILDYDGEGGVLTTWQVDDCNLINIYIEGKHVATFNYDLVRLYEKYGVEINITFQQYKEIVKLLSLLNIDFNQLKSKSKAIY